MVCKYRFHTLATQWLQCSRRDACRTKGASGLVCNCKSQFMIDQWHSFNVTNVWFTRTGRCTVNRLWFVFTFFYRFVKTSFTACLAGTTNNIVTTSMAYLRVGEGCNLYGHTERRQRGRGCQGTEMPAFAYWLSLSPAARLYQNS